jgi:tRNA A-37 threonylcarbamoyl transferase component Bud32
MGNKQTIGGVAAGPTQKQHTLPLDYNRRISKRPYTYRPTRSSSRRNQLVYRKAAIMSTPLDEDAVAAADKEMEERANRAKMLLSQRYMGLKQHQVDKHVRKTELEKNMIGLPEMKKQELRKALEHEENLIHKESRKKISVADFESLAVIGRGAFGEVRLVRRKGKKSDSYAGQIFALKSMKKEAMVIKNQVHHVNAEREALSAADDANPWLTALYYSFFDEHHLYMVMSYMPGGDLMSLLIREDTFSEQVTRFFMGEAAQAISSVHALGYIHRDIKPDNMLLDAYGHLRLTDLGLCKKVGDVSPADEPEAILRLLRSQSSVDGGPVSANSVFSEGVRSDNKHRDSGDAMAMSIDGGPAKRDPQTRREVSTTLYVWFIQSFSSSIGLTETHSLSTDGLQYCSK